MNGPLSVADIMERIGLKVPALKFIGHAADLQTAIEQQPQATPAAFVVSEERAGRLIELSEYDLEQEIVVIVKVVIFVRNRARQSSGTAARQEMEALARPLRLGLVGWSPTNCEEPLQFHAAIDAGYANGTLICQELFKTKYRQEVEVDG